MENNLSSPQLTSEEQAQLVSLLYRLTPGALPPEIFIAICRVTVMVAVEFMVFRSTPDGAELLLTQRPDDDPMWPGQWHSPGTIIRPTDTNLNNCFERLFTDELADWHPGEPMFMGYDYGHGTRGSGVTLQYIIDATGQDAQTGQFFKLDQLPADCIQEQIPMWQKAQQVFAAMTTAE